MIRIRIAVVMIALLAASIAAAVMGLLPVTGDSRNSFPATSPASAPEVVEPSGPQPQPRGSLPPGVEVCFTDATRGAHIDFKHFDGATPVMYIMETMGSGLGWLDYDQDGLMDLFIVQGSTYVAPHTALPPTCKLYKNLGGGRFRDVTEEVGLAHRGCGMGIAVGDIDNDGYPDLFLTCYGKPNVLYHNVSDGKGGRRFEDITVKAGLGDHPDWHTHTNFSTSAAFLDYDNDGLLDLFVCSYAKIDLAHYPVCKTPKGNLSTCTPFMFEGTRCLLYRNNGDGTFTDVSKAAGIDEPNAKALGVVALDLDDDGLIDIFVANDSMPNFLFRNTGHGRFESMGLLSGCAVNLEGKTQAYMGVEADDLDGDGLPDLFVTAFSQETNTFFRNQGNGRFLDSTRLSGLGPPSWWMLAFGTAFIDVDRDGNLDILSANGHVTRNIEENGQPQVTFRQKLQLFRNEGHGHFHDISAQSGAYFDEPHVGRGVAVCDYDNDGHMDVAISNNGEAAYLLHNESKDPNHWLRLELRGTKSNRDAVGARVVVHLGDGRNLVRHRKGGGSYLSASDPRLLIGLGSATQANRVEIRWPSGTRQQVGPLPADKGYLIIEGKDQVIPRP